MRLSGLSGFVRLVADAGYDRILPLLLALAMVLAPIPQLTLPAQALTTISANTTCTSGANCGPGNIIVWNGGSNQFTLSDSLTINSGITLRIVNANGVDGSNFLLTLPNGGSLIVSNTGVINLGALSGNGNGGNFTVNLGGATGTVNISGIIRANGLGTGRGGTITLNGSTYTLAGTGIVEALGGPSGGQGGVVNITKKAGTGIITLPQSFLVQTTGASSASQNLITITSDAIDIDGQLIADGIATSSAGKITLTANNGQIRVTKNGDVNARGVGAGTSGTIELFAAQGAQNLDMDNCGNNTCTAAGDTELIVMHNSARLNVSGGSANDGTIRIGRATNGTIDQDMNLFRNNQIQGAGIVIWGDDGGKTGNITFSNYAFGSDFGGSNPEIKLIGTGTITATTNNNFDKIYAQTTGNNTIDITDKANGVTITGLKGTSGAATITANNATNGFITLTNPYSSVADMTGDITLQTARMVTAAAADNVRYTGTIYINGLTGAGSASGAVDFTNTGAALDIGRIRSSSATLASTGAASDITIANATITGATSINSGRDINAGSTTNSFGTTTAATGRNITLYNNAGNFVLNGVTSTGTMTLSNGAANTNMTLSNIDAGGTAALAVGTGTSTISGNTNLVFRGAAGFNAPTTTGTNNINLTGDFQGNTSFTGNQVTATDTAGNFTVTTFNTGNSASTSTLTANAGNLSVAGLNLNSTGAGLAGRLDSSASGDVSINGSGWTTTNDIVNAWSTGGGNMTLSNTTLGGTAPLTATVGSTNPAQAATGIYFRTDGGGYTFTGNSINHNTSVTSKGSITGTGNTFTGTTGFLANAGATPADISITTSDFQNASNTFNGRNVTVGDTNALTVSSVTATGTGAFTATGAANDLLISNAAVTGNTTLNSGRDITATSNDNFGTITASGGRAIAITESSNININSITNTGTGTTTLISTDGSIIGKNNATADITTGTGALTATAGDAAGDAGSYVNLNLNTGGNATLQAYGNNGSTQSIIARGDVAGNLIARNGSGGTNATTGHIVLGDSTKALNVSGTTYFSAANTRDVTGIGNYTGNVAGTGGRIGFTVNAGNFTAGTVNGVNGLTAANGTGWWGAADESLIINTVNGDILGSGYTTSGAANIRLQAGTTSSLLATNNINVNNVVSGQDLALYATGDSLGTGNGTAIQVGGTSTVAGTITASGFNASNYFSAANGAIDITLSSGNLNTALAWTQNDNINLTTTNGGILQNFAKYGYNGKTIYTNGGDVTLTANGASGYINTGVNALGAGSDLTAKAGGQNGGLSVQLYGRVDGNLTVHNTSGAANAVTGNVNLGTSLGGSITNLNDTYTVEDVLGTTTVRALGDVGMYGMFIGAVNIYNANDVTIDTDKGDVTVNTITATGDISLTSRQKSIIANTLQSTGGGNILLQAGTSFPQNKFSNINVSNISTSGNLTAETWGTTTGNQAGNAIIISGTVGGSKTTTTHTGGVVSVP